MTKDEALRLALEALVMLLDNYVPEATEEDISQVETTITAIKAALEAKDEPIKLRRGDILRCNESDELCTVWATSTSGKTLVKWKDNDFGNYTAEQIGELFWIEPKEEDEPDYKALWQQMCERCDELDKKLAQPKHGWTPERIAGVARLKAQQDSRFEPQRTWVGLTDEEISELIRATHNTGSFVRAIEAKLKQKNFKE
jgi:hypothetical protein